MKFSKAKALVEELLSGAIPHPHNPGLKGAADFVIFRDGSEGHITIICDSESTRKSFRSWFSFKEGKTQYYEMNFFLLSVQDEPFYILGSATKRQVIRQLSDALK